MVQVRKVLIFGAAIWFALAFIWSALGSAGEQLRLFSATDVALLMIPISVIVIVFGAIKYLKEIHAQYEQEGLEVAAIWSLEALFLEALIVGVLYGQGIDHFLLISTWLGVAFKFVFPLAAGFYMQHTMTES